MGADHDAIAQADLGRRDLRDLLAQHCAVLEKGSRIVEYDARLILAGGQHQHVPDLTRRQLGLNEARLIDRERGGHPALASAAADNGP